MTAGPEQIAEALDRLARGGVVAFPTETVYGLGADAFNEAAVRRVFELKGRPAHNPLIVHVADEAGARRVSSEWPEAARRLAAAFWPGPLTIVVPRAPDLPDIVTAGGPTVAVRAPAHHITLALLQAYGRPLVGPSANPSGRISPTTADHVRASFPSEAVYVLDGGPCRGGIESTVVAPEADRAVILRPGLVAPDQIARVLGLPVVPATRSADHGPGPLPSPGMLEAHYAPQAPAVLFGPEHWPGLLARAGGPVVVISPDLRSLPEGHSLVLMPTGPREYASRLYSGLREADELAPALIAVERPWPRRGPTPEPGDDPVWWAIADRLARATRPA